MSYVTDMTHYAGVLDPSSSAPGPAKKIARFLGRIVQAATAWPPNDLLATALPCRRRPGKKACPGRIRLVLVTHDGSAKPVADVRILWECPACNDNGVIHNWNGTEWDLSDLERDPGFWDSETLHVLLTDAEHEALREELTQDRRHVALVMVARGDEGGPTLELTLGELKSLLTGVVSSIQAAPRARRAALQSAAAKLTAEIVADGTIH